MTIAHLFPGQGSQAIGMGRDVYERVPAARELFDQADDILGFALSTLCFEGPEAHLTDTVNQQPALFVTSMATLAAVEAAGWPTPTFVAGHSLGEISALVAAGSIAFADGLRLVRTRGELMKRAGTAVPGSMAAVLAAEVDTVRQACAEAQNQTGEVVQIANDNCPGQIVISGGTAAVQAASDWLTAAGVKRVVPLPITIAAHSPLMASAAADFSAAVEATPILAPRLPVIANTTATPLTSAAEIRAELTAQLTGPVRWTESMQYLVAQGVDTVVEVGAGDTLQSLMKRIERGVKRLSFSFA